MTEKNKKKQYKLDIGKVLEAADRHNLDFYSTLSDEEKKAFTPYTVMRFMSSVKDASVEGDQYFLLMINDIVNRNFFDLGKHPELQWKLLALIGTGKKYFHNWIAPIGKKSKASRVRDLLIKRYETLKEDDIDLLISINSTEDIVNLAKDMGYPDDEISQIKKELK